MDRNSRISLLESRVTRKAVKRGSEGGSWKSAWHSQECLVTRWLPTLPHVRFGGGRLEKGRSRHLVSRLPDTINRTQDDFKRLNVGDRATHPAFNFTWLSPFFCRATYQTVSS
jgi:hypothetical protein